MSASNFNTSNLTFRKIFGNGLMYRVPRFQRDYSWTQDEWDDLWQDIQGTLQPEPEGENAHYMGYLVLQSSDEMTFDVIDGQQRLTTLSLLVLAVLKTLNDLIERGVDVEDTQRRMDQLRNSYIGYLNPITLVPQCKLTLNRNNDAYYKDHLVPLTKLPQRNLRASEQLLRRAFEWFYKHVSSTYKTGESLALFIETLANKLFFTVINVTDELNAFKVFETLNARGVRLSPTDLLKNYLFSVVHKETRREAEIESLERRWEAIVGQLGEESFPDFLRVHWNSRRNFVRQAELFKTIRNATTDPASVFDLLRNMEEDVGVYVALSNPEDGYWQDTERDSARELRMFSVRQPWSLLMAAGRAFNVDGYRSLLRACSVISFRYNVIGGLGTHEQERVYASVALKIIRGEITEASAAIRALSTIYPDDESFRVAFKSKALTTSSHRNRKIVRYILFKIERHLTHTDYDAESAKYTLEHILPENPEENWPQFSDKSADELVYRLGNMTLIEENLNREAGNAPFNGKKEVFAKSVFRLTSKIAEDNDIWTDERLASRQDWMAKQATAIWTIPQLH